MNILVIRNSQIVEVVLSSGQADVTSHYAQQRLDGALLPYNTLIKVAGTDPAAVLTGPAEGAHIVKELTVAGTQVSGKTEGRLQIRSGGSVYVIATFSLDAGETWSFGN